MWNRWDRSPSRLFYTDSFLPECWQTNIFLLSIPTSSHFPMYPQPCMTINDNLCLTILITYREKYSSQLAAPQSCSPDWPNTAIRFLGIPVGVADGGPITPGPSTLLASIVESKIHSPPFDNGLSKYQGVKVKWSYAIRVPNSFLLNINGRIASDR